MGYSAKNAIVTCNSTCRFCFAQIAGRFVVNATKSIVSCLAMFHKESKTTVRCSFTASPAGGSQLVSLRPHVCSGLLSSTKTQNNAEFTSHFSAQIAPSLEWVSLSNILERKNFWNLVVRVIIPRVWSRESSCMYFNPHCFQQRLPLSPGSTKTQFNACFWHSCAPYPFFLQNKHPVSEPIHTNR